MENITEALKNLYVAFGDSLDDVENVPNIADMIDAFVNLSFGRTLIMREVEQNVFDKSWQDVYDALSAGKVVVVMAENSSENVSMNFINEARFSMGEYTVGTINGAMTFAPATTPTENLTLGGK